MVKQGLTNSGYGNIKALPNSTRMNVVKANAAQLTRCIFFGRFHRRFRSERFHPSLDPSQEEALTCDRRFSAWLSTSLTRACKLGSELSSRAWCVASRLTELRVWKISGQSARGSEDTARCSSWLGFGDGRMS